MDDQPNLSIAGGNREGTGLLSDYVRARLSPAADAYWVAIKPNVPFPWNDGFSKGLGLLCELLAERDEVAESINRTSDVECGMMVGQKGELRRHPLATRLANIETRLGDMMRQFGMTPEGLKKLNGSSGRKKDGPASLKSLIS